MGDESRDVASERAKIKKIKMIDSHVHLNHREYGDDLEAVVERAVQAGVTGMVNIGFDLESSRESCELAKKYPFMYAAVGVHPHEARGFDNRVEGEIKKLLRRDEVIALGEIGLDFYRDLSPREKQREVFRRQLGLAREAARPVIIHCREAFEEVVQVLEEEGDGYTGVFHAFSGSEVTARKLLKMGFRLGIGGVITFRNSRLSRVVSELPPESLVLETDCPYLAPAPFRGKRNEPAFLTYIIQAVARAQKVSPDDVVRTTDLNFSRSMGLEDAVSPAVVYRIRWSLYINMTNRCTNRCVFCSRESDPVVRGYNLGLEKEPSTEEVIGSVGDPSSYEEIVFCGYGEPMLRLPEVIEVARTLRKKGAKLRLDTNGLGNLIWKRDIILDLKGIFDVISVSLNTSDPELYTKLCRPVYNEKSFSSLLDFVRSSVGAGIETICTAVEYPGVDIPACERLARSLGAKFRARKYNVLG